MGVLQSLVTRLLGFLPNLVLRKVYPESYFRAKLLVNMGDHTPSLYIQPDGSGRLTGLSVAVTNLLPFKLEVNFTEVELSIGHKRLSSSPINKTIDSQRISRQTLTLPEKILPADVTQNHILSRDNLFPLLEYSLSYRVRHALWSFNAEVQLSAVVRVDDVVSAAGIPASRRKGQAVRKRK